MVICITIHKNSFSEKFIQKAPRPRDSSLNVNKVEKELGIKMETCSESLKRMALWYRDSDAPKRIDQGPIKYSDGYYKASEEDYYRWKNQLKNLP